MRQSDANILRKILFFVTEDWFFCSHFLDRARAARQEGYKVTVVTRGGNHVKTITGEGLRHIPIAVERRNMNPLRDVGLLRTLVEIYRQERPDIAHHVAFKPIIYGSFAAKLARVPHVINAPVGLGYVFSSTQLKAKLAKPLAMLLYKLWLQPLNGRVILENSDDLCLLSKLRLIDESQTVLIRGAGVDTSRYVPTPEPQGEIVVIFPARMLWDKGVGEFVDAARQLREQKIAAQLILVGQSDPGNPCSVPVWQLEQWHESGVVAWWGFCDDMPRVFAESHVVCLPSYREGLPKVLIEAAACGRSIVTTDVPGCREVVQNENNGLLVPARNSTALAAALRRLILSPALRQFLRRRAREIAETEFTVEKVNERTLAVYRELLIDGELRGV